MSIESISIINIHNILIVTVPSDPDDDTVSLLQEKILTAMESKNSQGLILDISTVETLDSFFARVIVETTDMVALMGGKTVISGMQPSVAITVTQLGLSLGPIKTALNIERALKYFDTTSI